MIGFTGFRGYSLISQVVSSYSFCPFICFENLLWCPEKTYG